MMLLVVNSMAESCRARCWRVRVCGYVRVGVCMFVCLYVMYEGMEVSRARVRIRACFACRQWGRKQATQDHSKKRAKIGGQANSKVEIG